MPELCEHCGAQSLFQVVEAKNRKLVGYRFLCDDHAQELLRPYCQPGPTLSASASVSARGGVVELDLELIALHWDNPTSAVYLRAVGESRHWFFLTGKCEAWAIAACLGQEGTGPPTTHQAMAGTIAGLGGELRDTLVDGISDGRYHASLRIAVANTEVVVGVRPSDAIALALVSNVPILILEHLL